MIRTLRVKLLWGLVPLLAIMVALGGWAIVMFGRLGNNIDVILRENYRSVLACEAMKEALERMDSAAHFAINGQEELAHRDYPKQQETFRHALSIEANNVTLPTEQTYVDSLSRLSNTYFQLSKAFYDLPPASTERREIYFNQLRPVFDQIRHNADLILDINQENMEAENNRARNAAAVSARVMVAALVASAVVATAISLALSRSILQPIRIITAAAAGMSKGNYDQVVPATTHDELADLAETINTLARRIREYQQAGTARLVRAQRTAQASIDSLPDPVVVVDPDGNVERFNPAARRVLGLEGTAGLVAWQVPSTVQPHLKEVLSGGADHLPSSLEYAIPLRDEGQEKFYLPRVLAIRSENELLGAALVFTEVTKFRLVDQLKSDMVATVSHELKTPLTSLQMAIHLLLEESVGMLNAKQVDLLLSARQDSDRLLAMVNDLLDLTRIEQGHVRLDLRPVASADLIASAYERFEPIARDARVSLKASVPFGLPPVRVDEERIAHVFDNLINNAISHSTAGGVVQISAERVDNSIRFSITDTGAGIPQQYLPRVFERFFRVPNERNPGGVGLGLAIARDVVEAHQGQIFVESEPGKGTTFSFELPVDLDGGNPTLEVNRVATGA